jgi:hypothetical protein
VDHVFEVPPERISTSSSSGTTYRHVLSAASDASPWRQVEMVKDPADRSQLVRTHARWDDTMSANILDWLQLASREPAFDELLSARLKHAPKDTLLLRFEQDSSEGAKHEAVCARQSALADAEPAQANLQYLRIRCMSDDQQQNAQFISAQEKWPDNPWLSLAAGATYAERGDYVQALPRYEIARKRLVAMRGYLSLDAARLRRLNSAGGKVNLSDLVAHSDQLAMFMAIESGKDLEGTSLEPYYSMAQGNLGAAVVQAKKIKDGSERVLRLVASSEGATREMIEEALALPLGDSDGFEDTIAMYALAVRNQRDPEPYLAHIGKMLGERGKPVLVFLERVRSGANPEQARAELPQSDFSLRLHALHAAVIMLGQRAPADWRKESSLGLFDGERGYMRSL